MAGTLGVTLLSLLISSVELATPSPGTVASGDEGWRADTPTADVLQLGHRWRDSDATSTPVRARPVDVPEVPLVESRVIDPAMCEPGASVAYDPLYAYRCDGGDTTCAEGEILQPPREVRRRTSPSETWTPWEQVSGWTCVTPGTNDLEASVRSAFAEMTITPSPITVIDGRGWTFVQIDTVIYSDAEPRTLNTTVADTPVQLRATPIEWAWTFEDGTPPQRTSTPAAPGQTPPSPTSTRAPAPTPSP